MFEDSALSIWASMSSWLTPTVLFLLLNLMIGTIVIASSSSPNPPDQTQTQTQTQTQQHQQGLVRSTSVLQRFKSINFYSYRSPDPDTHFEHHDPTTKHLVRSSSILQRLQSIKFHFHFPRPEPAHDVIQQEAQTETQLTHYASEEDNSSDDEEEERHEVMELDDDDDVDKFEKDQTLDEIYRRLEMERGHVSRTTSDTKPASGEVPAKLPRKMRKSASAKSAFGHFAEDEVTVVERRRPATVKETKKDESDEDDDVDGGDGGGEVDAKADDFINKFKQQLKLQRIDSIIRYKDMIKKGSQAK